MARVPLSLVPDAGPAPTPPSDYQSIPQGPDSFGGQIGAAEQRFGAEGQKSAGDLAQGAEILQQRFNQTAGDDAMNKFMDQGDRLTYGTPGDPNAPKGLYALKGSEALSRGPEVVTSLTNLRNQIKDGLQNDAQKLQFDEQSRRYYQYKSSEISRHLSSQADVYSAGVAEARIGVAARQAASAFNSDEQIMHSLADAQGGADQLSGLKYGANPDKAIIEQGQVAARTKVIQDAVYGAMATDPANGALRAQQILGKFGSLIDPHTLEILNNQTKGAAEQAGVAAGIRGTMSRPLGAAPNPAVLGQIQKSAVEEGVPVNQALTIAHIESRTGTVPDAAGNTHHGIFQLGENERASVGLSDNAPLVEQAAKGVKFVAGAYKLASETVGRPAQGWETYMVHQQGAGGGPALLKADPSQNVVDALAPAYKGNRSIAAQAVSGNGGNPNGSVGDFLQHWQQTYVQKAAEAGVDAAADAVPVGGGSPTGTPSRNPEAYGEEYRRLQAARSDAARAYPNNPRLQKEWVDGVWQEIQQTNVLQAKYQAEQQKALKDGQEAAANTVVTTLLSDPMKFDMATITHNPTLTAEQKMTLSRFAEEQFKKAGRDDFSGFGPGFTNVYQQIMAPPGDPARMTDMTDIFKHAGPGGDVSLHGVDVLRNIFLSSRKNPDQHANQAIALSFIQDAKSRLSFQQDLGPIKILDPKGEHIFNAEFVPEFWRRISQAQATGDQAAVDKVLNKDNVDKMIAGLRNSTQMAKERMAASGQLDEGDLEQPNAPLPPVPSPLDKVREFPLRNAPGMVAPGNLDPWNRPVLHNPDGSYSTTSSMSIGTDKGETLIPTVVDGKRLTEDQAIEHYRKTGQSFGTFTTPAQADDYAIKLHKAQAGLYDEHGTPLPKVDATEWAHIMTSPPMAANGKPFTHNAWAETLRVLLDNPKQAGPWFDKMFAPSGYRAKDIVDRLMKPVDQVPNRVDLMNSPFAMVP